MTQIVNLGIGFVLVGTAITAYGLWHHEITTIAVGLLFVLTPIGMAMTSPITNKEEQ